MKATFCILFGHHGKVLLLNWAEEGIFIHTREDRTRQTFLPKSGKVLLLFAVWAFLPLSFSLLSFLFLPKVIPEIERGRGYRKFPLPLNFRDDSCLQGLDGRPRPVPCAHR